MEDTPRVHRNESHSMASAALLLLVLDGHGSEGRWSSGGMVLGEDGAEWEREQEESGEGGSDLVVVGLGRTPRIWPLGARGGRREEMGRGKLGEDAGEELEREGPEGR
jgi:hypothetical protein